MEPIERAFASLQGLSVGDALGSHFELDHLDWDRPKRAAARRELPPGTWRYTDDTQMALSIYANLRQFGTIDSDKLAESFSQHFDISRGYGAGAISLLRSVQAGGDWKSLAPSLFGGSGSFGNGSSMRVAPIGAYFADRLDDVVHFAQQSSIITHTHPDAIAGAIAVAVGAAMAAQRRKDDYWDTILDRIPGGKLKEAVQTAANLDTSTEEAAKTLGCGWEISAVDTVPFVLWCAITYLDDFEEALWQTISVGGDADTTAAMVGGIVASDGRRIPEDWLQRRENLPAWALG